MPELANNLEERHEFWRPPMQDRRHEGRTTAETCERCGTDFIVGARFCHVCGHERMPLVGRSETRFSRFFEMSRIKEALGLSTGALIAFVIGVGCVLAAIGTGLMYTAATVLDWQAVQMWRVEWLLAAITTFVAGILLKRWGQAQ